jgi:predicted 2-oxoglutarate/Fe(II)-dependent dioxygenase YbiX
LFARFGLFVARNFFDQTLCRSIRSELASAPEELAKVGKAYELKPNIRSARVRKPSASICSTVRARLEELRPVLSQHFGIPLAGFEDGQFLCYKEGDHHRLHQDRNEDPDAPAFLRKRKVSVVLFLNAAVKQPAAETYGGGSLTFFGLLQDPNCAFIGLGVDGEEGLLIAFWSEVYHAVTPVTHGERYTFVDWFF